MKALLQRVREARVEIAGQIVGAIGAGLLVMLCAERGDAQARAAHPVVETGEFGGDMQVHLVNDGLVTIPLQS